MKRELVKSLRTVVLLAMFSQDSTTVANIQSCLKSMCTMEPDLILHPILERAVPSLEALVEVSCADVFEKPSHKEIDFHTSADSTNHRSYQSPRCCCTCHCLAWCLLSWSQAPRPYPAAADSWHWSSQRHSPCVQVFLLMIYLQNDPAKTVTASFLLKFCCFLIISIS